MHCCVSKHITEEIKLAQRVHLGFDGTTIHGKKVIVVLLFMTVNGKPCKRTLGVRHLKSNTALANAEGIMDILVEKKLELSNFGSLVMDSCSTNVGCLHGVHVELGVLASKKQGREVHFEIMHCYCHKLHNMLASGLRVACGGGPDDAKRQGWGQAVCRLLESWTLKIAQFR